MDPPFFAFRFWQVFCTLYEGIFCNTVLKRPSYLVSLARNCRQRNLIRSPAAFIPLSMPEQGKFLDRAVNFMRTAKQEVGFTKACIGQIYVPITYEKILNWTFFPQWVSQVNFSNPHDLSKIKFLILNMPVLFFSNNVNSFSKYLMLCIRHCLPRFAGRCAV